MAGRTSSDRVFGDAGVPSAADASETLRRADFGDGEVRVPHARDGRPTVSAGSAVTGVRLVSRIGSGERDAPMP